MMLILVLVLATIGLSASSFLVGFHKSPASNDLLLVNSGFRFIQEPSGEQVADLLARMQGMPPLYSEDNVDFPSLVSLSQDAANLQIVLYNGAMPKGLFENVATCTKPEATVPSLPEISTILNVHGIHLSVVSLDASTDISQWLAQQNQNVLVLNSAGGVKRSRSLGGDDAATVPQLSEFQISQYQICLWSAVGFVLLVAASVCSLAQMEVLPDSLLYAKFQSGRTGKLE